jgi:hypothetical protein
MNYIAYTKTNNMPSTTKVIRIYETDDYMEMAEKIYYHFEVNQSCTIKGFVFDEGEPIPKGKLVLDHINNLDKTEHYDKRSRRKRVKLPNSIGDYVAGKIFKWDERIQDRKIIYLIWRVQ